jgi:hypothetical protein
MGAIDEEIGAAGEAFEIVDEVAIERDAARDGERGKRRGVERGQAQQLRRLQGADAALLGAADEIVEGSPGRLALAAEVKTLEMQLGHRRSLSSVADPIR